MFFGCLGVCGVLPLIATVATTGFQTTACWLLTTWALLSMCVTVLFRRSKKCIKKLIGCSIVDGIHQLTSNNGSITYVFCIMFVNVQNCCTEVCETLQQTCLFCLYWHWETVTPSGEVILHADFWPCFHMVTSSGFPDYDDHTEYSTHFTSGSGSMCTRLIYAFFSDFIVTQCIFFCQRNSHSFPHKRRNLRRSILGVKRHNWPNCVLTIMTPRADP